MCRMYNKTLEIKRSGKNWFEHLWSENGWEKGKPVTRIEFQCRRKIIRMMKIETIEDLFSIVPDLWKYLTVEWLAIRIIQKDSHRTRWPASQFWRIIQYSVAWFGQTTGVSRIKQLRAKTMGKPGYIAGETLIRSDKPGESLVVTKWQSEYYWNQWLQSEERLEIQSKIDELLGEETQYEVYEYD